MIIRDEIKHYGTPRHSGRYPWGTTGWGKGEDDASRYKRNKDFLDTVASLRKQGLSPTEIARGLGMSTREYKALNSIARNEKKQADIAFAQRLRDKGTSYSEIGTRMGLNESSVRSLLKDGALDRLKIQTATTDALRDAMVKNPYLDIGAGVEHHMNVSRAKLDSSIEQLVAEGYTRQYVKVPNSSGKETTIKVLVPPGVEYSETYANRDKIAPPLTFSEDGGRSYLGMHEPLSVDSSRLSIVYGDKGAQADGVVYVRPGVDDISLGGSNYAQVRIAIDGSHYIKGMAIYKSDLPDGVDLVFNTPKDDTGNKLDALKPLKADSDNPFGSQISRQIIDVSGGKERVTSAMNLVNESGDWDDWSRNLSAQMLSKQSPSLVKERLEATFASKKAEYDEIMSLTNPTVREALLTDFTNTADSSAVHLKANALPRQATQVILPVKSLKDTEVFAPNFKDGETVALVRYPHAGTFEIPQLVVNNRNKDAVKLIGKDARDAIGINPEVAKRLSGADFDGDAVVVIPNNDGRIKSSPALEGLKNFDPQRAYPGYKGIPEMSDKTKQREMGAVSNLITDMQIKGANPTEMAAAVRHSMVVIDAQKHGLNYKESARANGIAALKKKYQDDGMGGKGAATLVSRSSSEMRVPERREARASEGGFIDPATGRKVYVETGGSYKKKVVKKDGTVEYVDTPSITKTTKMAETHDARTLMSKNPMPVERLYADYANKMKRLANEGRKQILKATPIPYDKEAAKVFKEETTSLTAKLKLAERNAPLERTAQTLADSTYRAKLRAKPNMDDATKKKIRAQALAAARVRTGSVDRYRVQITDDEWSAIQAGAVSPTKLRALINNSDKETFRKLALPRQPTVMTTAKQTRAKALVASGKTLAEVAQILGVAPSTLKSSLK